MSVEPKHTLANLDGIRGLASLLVFYHHLSRRGLFPPAYGLGDAGVMLFFVLSGFLMAYHYMPGQLSFRYWGSFITRRMFRVYPGFAVAVLLTWLAGVTTSIAPLTTFTWNRVVHHLLLIDGWSYTFWTIPIEIRFYFVFPVIAAILLLLPFARPGKIACLFACWLYLLSYNYLPVSHEIMQLLPYMELFTGGVCVNYLHHSYFCQLVSFSKYWNVAFGLCTFVLALLCIPSITRWIGMTNNWMMYMHPLSLLFMMFLLSASLVSTRVGFIFSNPCMRYVGKISYSIYLLHALIFWVVIAKLKFGAAIMIALCCVFSLAGALLLYYLVELPFLLAGTAISRRLLQH